MQMFTFDIGKNVIGNLPFLFRGTYNAVVYFLVRNTSLERVHAYFKSWLYNNAPQTFLEWKAQETDLILMRPPEKGSHICYAHRAYKNENEKEKVFDT